MHIYFSGIGGTGISALAIIAKQAGYDVSGSDARPSQYLDYLKKHGITDTHVGLERERIAAIHSANPIDWFVYGSAQPLDFPDNPEFQFCDEMGIKKSKRDELLNHILQEKQLKLIAVAGTHGKTTTTAMAVWLFKQLNIPISYSIGGKISFGDISQFDPASQYFVYEADEFDRNFLNFYPEVSLITGIDWDHPDIYPTRTSYCSAFSEFLGQSKQAVLWQDDAEKLELSAEDKYQIIDLHDPAIAQIKLPGLVNRLDAWLVINSLENVVGQPIEKLIEVMNRFPGVARRFEQLVPHIYTDYAHTPAKIRGALQLAHETAHSAGSGQAGDNVVVVYEGLHNTRQHFIKDELKNLFDDVKELYIVPSYLARENPNLEILTPVKLLNVLSNKSQTHGHAAELNDDLADVIKKHAATGDLVLCLSAGGAGSLDEWLRQEFSE